jgi:hypothetical protein
LKSSTAVGATFQPLAAFAHGGVPSSEKTSFILYWAAYCTARS